MISKSAVGLALAAVWAIGAQAVNIQFLWPSGTGGYYELPGSSPGSRYYATQTVGLTNGSTYTLYGAGLGSQTQVTLDGSGNATLINPQGIGLRDNGMVGAGGIRQYEFLPATVNFAFNGFDEWLQVQSVTGPRMTSDFAQKMVYGPSQILDSQGFSKTFSVDSAGKVTFAPAAPGFTVTGNTVAVNVADYRFSRGGFTGQYEVVGWTPGRVSVDQNWQLAPGTWSLNIFSNPFASFNFTITDGYLLQSGAQGPGAFINLPFTSGGVSYVFSIPEPASLALLALGALLPLRRRRT